MPVEPKPDALIGTVLEGRFEIERLLGEGGMGRVYVADETRLRRRCALKVLLPELSKDKDCVERFLHEAQAIAQIRHENVVEIYHLGEDPSSGVVFFAMELLQGEDLETRLLDRAGRPVLWDQVCHWIAQAAGAVGAVHQAGMIHRDLKPSNIFVARRRDGRDRIKLLDFGIAKAVNRAALTGAGAALGTPYYMSPEQILSLPLDPRSDIYSLGAVFFEALAGRMVFQGEPLQVAMQHCNTPPPRVRDVSSDEIPPEVDALVHRMLAKEPGARPQTMEEIEELLLNFAPTMHNSGLLYHSGLIVRPQTQPRTAQSRTPHRAAAPTLVAPLVEPASGSTPLPSASPLARTALALGGPRQASTVEIHLDIEPAPPPRAHKLPLILGGVTLALVAAITTLFMLPRGDPPASLAVAGDVVPQPVEPSPDPPVQKPREAVVLATPRVPVPVPPEPSEATTPGPPEPVKPIRKPERSSPMKTILRAAAACRKTAKAPRGPKITIDYAISSDGHVNRAVPATQDALGKCLAAAVKAAKFPPQLKLGLKVDL